MPVLLYSPATERYRWITRWQHTVLPMVVQDPIFWMLQLWHLYWLLTEHALIARGSHLPVLEWKAATMASGLLTFFVVFYGGHCYGRYFQLHQMCGGIGGSIAEWSYLVKAHFDGSPATVKWNLVRLMLAAMQIHYTKLGGEELNDAKDITDAEWRAIQRNNFLSAEEIRTIRKYRGAKCFLPAMWALAEVRAALKIKLKPLSSQAKTVKPLPDSPLKADKELEKNVKKPTVAQSHETENNLLHTPAAMRLLADFEEVALKFRSCCSGSLNLLNMPVPFAYFHLLKATLLVVLMLVSYALVELEQAQILLSVVIFLTVSSIMIGLQAVAVAMSDPFGADDLDFDLHSFMSSAYDNAIATLTDNRVALNDRLPGSIAENPLNDAENSRRIRTWAALTEGYDGLTAPIESLRPRSPTESGKALRLTKRSSNKQYSRLDNGNEVSLSELRSSSMPASKVLPPPMNPMAA